MHKITSSRTPLRISLVALVLLAAVGCRQDQVSEFDVEGVVADVHPDRQVLEIVHDDIPGYMPAMQMPFPVESPEMLEGLESGDQVQFQLTVTNGAAVITSVEKLPDYSGPLPEFNLENLDGESISSSDLLGKVAIINFWASWCEPCKVEMPALNQMAQDYADADFQVIGIAQDPENRGAISGVLEELGISYPILLTDPGSTLELAVGEIPVIPGTLVVDRDGQVVDKHLGLIDEAELRTLIESLL